MFNEDKVSKLITADNLLRSLSGWIRLNIESEEQYLKEVWEPLMDNEYFKEYCDVAFKIPGFEDQAPLKNSLKRMQYVDDTLMWCQTLEDVNKHWLKTTATYNKEKPKSEWEQRQEFWALQRAEKEAMSESINVANEVWRIAIAQRDGLRKYWADQELQLKLQKEKDLAAADNAVVEARKNYQAIKK